MEDSKNIMVKEIMKRHYFDLGVYRLMNRNKPKMKYWFMGTFLMILLGAIAASLTTCLVFGALFIGPIWLGGLDHFIIGKSKAKIERKFLQKGITITWEDACEIYGLK